MTLYAAGLRLSEASHLKIADIDSARMQLNIAHVKGAKQRLVPLNDSAISSIADYLEQQRSELAAMAVLPPEWLLLSRSGRRLRRDERLRTTTNHGIPRPLR